MRRYVHLGINPLGAGSVPAANPNALLEPLLTQRADWYRYARQNYVLFTDANLSSLSNEIKALPGFHSAFVLLVEMPAFDSLKINGWMDPKFWKWLQGQRQF